MSTNTSPIKTTRAHTKRPYMSDYFVCFDCGEVGKRGGMMLVKRVNTYPNGETGEIVTFVHRKHGR